MDEDDVHMCLACNQTIHGLLSYVDHKKNGCSAKKPATKAPSAPTLHGTGATVAGASKASNSGGTMFADQGFFGDSPFTSSQTEVFVDAVSGLLSDSTALLPSLSSQPSTIQSDSALLSSPMNLSVFQNNTTTDSTMLTSALSPVFSTAQTSVDDEDQQEENYHDGSGANTTEDHGIMNAVLKKMPHSQEIKQAKPRNQRLEYNLNSLSFDTDYTEKSSRTDEKVPKGDLLDDFFGSLELMSKANPKPDRGLNDGQLPISNILNSLTFDSEEEDLGFTLGDDVSFDSLTDDSNDEMAPPAHHTGGKWKPGEKPAAYWKNRQQSRGKWPPGETPTYTLSRKGPSHRGKNINLIKGLGPKSKRRGRSTKKEKAVAKVFVCKWCDISFDNRFKYSHHCGTAEHKRNLSKEEGSTSCKAEVISVLTKQAETFLSKPSEIKNDYQADTDVEEEPNEAPVVKTEVTDYVEKKTHDPDVENNDQDDDGDINDDKDVDDDDDNVKAENDKVLESDADNDDDFVDEVYSKDNDVQDEGPLKGNRGQIAVKIVHICSVCDRKYPNKILMARHMLSKFHKTRALAHEKEHFEMLQKYHKVLVRLSPYQCSVCKYYYVQYDKFMEHLHSKEHADNCEELLGEMQCTLCKCSSHNLQLLLNHFNSPDHKLAIEQRHKLCIFKEVHVQNSCKYCGLVMQSFGRLQHHIKLKHQDKQVVHGVKKRVKGVRNRPICPYCQKKFSTNQSRDMHVSRRHTPSGEQKYGCDICKKRFADKHALRLHNKSIAHTMNLVKHDEIEGKSEQNKNEEMVEGSSREEKESCKSDTKQASPDGIEDRNVEKMMPHESNASAEKLDGPSSQAETSSTAVSVQVGNDSDTDCDYMEKEEKTLKGKNGSVKTQKSNGSGKRKYTKRKNSSVKCTYCDFIAESYDGLRPHYVTKHSRQIRTCEPCDMIFMSEKAFKLHWNGLEHQRNLGKSASNVKLYECSVCNRQYQDEKSRDFHTAYQHYHPTTDAAAIKELGGTSLTEEKYKDFLKSIEDKRHDDRIQCIECDTKVKKNNLMVHLRNHTDEKLYTCKLCNRGFIASFTLRKHLAQHFGCNDRMCDVCGKSFEKVQSFERHMYVHKMESKAGSKNFVCDICSEAFFLDSQLRRHRKRHEEKKFKCDFPGCMWKFVFKGELNSHKKTHFAENRKYLCDLCGFAAFTPYHLKRHKRTHTSERKFHCDYCTYKTGSKAHLQRHMRIHTGAKPFKCPYCDYACNTHENIRKHIVETKKHKGMKMYPCKFCEYATNSCNDFRAHLMSLHEKESGIGVDFRDPAYTAFTGVYQRALDMTTPEEGTKIIPLKERKSSRRKKYDSDSDENEEMAHTGPTEPKQAKDDRDQIVDQNTEYTNIIANTPVIKQPQPLPKKIEKSTSFPTAAPSEDQQSGSQGLDYSVNTIVNYPQSSTEGVQPQIVSVHSLADGREIKPLHEMMRALGGPIISSAPMHGYSMPPAGVTSYHNMNMTPSYHGDPTKTESPAVGFGMPAAYGMQQANPRQQHHGNYNNM